ncbi:predicted protein, partial [Nematostella vectensis]
MSAYLLHQVYKVRISHDNTNPDPAWFLEKLTIYVEDQDQKYIFPFPCRCWLAEDEDDGQTVRKLRPGETLTYPYESKLAQVDESTFYGAYSAICYFQIKTVELGQEGPGRGVFVEEVEVRAKGKDPVIFPCQCWLDESEGDGQTTRVLTPNEPAAPMQEDILYNATFETGDIPFAGTDANVFLQMTGEEGTTGKIEFSQDDGAPTRFGKGRIDKFAVETIDVGKLTSVRVGHDNTGRSPKWFLKQLMIDIPCRDEHYVFPFNDWITGDEVDLQPGTLNVKMPRPNNKIPFRLKQITGSQPDAGTSANVFFQLHGDKESTEEILLKDENANLFARSGMDKFKVETRDVGKIESLRVGHDNAGPSPEWYLEQVCIDTKDERSVFNVNQWIGGRNPTVVKVRPEPYEKLPGTISLSQLTFLADLDYRVTIKTGDEPEAGTDANVFLTMYGERGPSAKFLLKDNEDRNQFSRGRTDKFAIRAKDLGKLTRIRVSRDNAGVRPGWLLDKVVIDIPAKMEQYTVFPCRCWLGMDENNMVIVRELLPGQPAPDDVEGEFGARRDFCFPSRNFLRILTLLLLYYHLTILTADKPNAGTESKVYFRLYGDKGETSDIILADERFKRFERGRADKFVVQTADVGKLNRMVIGHNNTGVDPPWLLEEVHVDIPSRNEHYVFKCGRWLAVVNGKDETETVLYPGKLLDFLKVSVGGLLFKTADEPGAGTDCSVYCQMIGDNGDTREIDLGENKDAMHFQQGQTDRFRIRAKDVGKLRTFRVGHDNRGSRPRWLLDEIVVYHIARKERYVFKNNRWI